MSPARRAVSRAARPRRDRSVAVAVWTVNDRALLQTMEEIGVDTVITDDVALALAVLDPV